MRSPTNIERLAVVIAVFGVSAYRVAMLLAVLERLRQQRERPYLALALMGEQAAVWSAGLAGQVDLCHVFHGDTSLFQKEALYNAMEPRLPPDVDGIVFLDADTFPGADDWTARLRATLAINEVVQGFDRYFLLARAPTVGILMNARRSRSHEEMVGEIVRQPTEIDVETFTNETETLCFSGIIAGMSEVSYGNPGVSWGVRRSFFRAVGGFPWTEVFSGANDLCWVYELTGFPTERFDEGLAVYAAAADLQPRLRGKCSVGHVDLPLYHLWHKKWCDRAYIARQSIMAESGFDPRVDVTLSEHGTIALTLPGRRHASQLSALREQVLEPEVPLSGEELRSVLAAGGFA